LKPLLRTIGEFIDGLVDGPQACDAIKRKRGKNRQDNPERQRQFKFDRKSHVAPVIDA
jgi:hypothetical protein